MITDKNRIYDGFLSCEGGVDAGRIANKIALNQAVEAENVTFRGGEPTTRPGWRKLTGTLTNPNLGYDDNGVLTGAPTDAQKGSARYPAGVFQGATFYAARGGDACIIAMIDGRMFKLVPGDYTVSISEIALLRQNRASLTKAYLNQADKWLIIQDGESLPIIYNGATARRSASDEVPVGTIMAYGLGRIVVILPDFQSIEFGDLYGSHAGADAGDSVIKFTETTFLTGGFNSSIPFALGTITAASFFPQLDTSTGQGPLMVFTNRGAASFAVNLDRTQWQTGNFQSETLLSTGVRGWRSVEALNEDLFFRSDDGQRTFRQARSEASGWHHLPLSTNVEQWFDRDTPWLRDYTSAITFDNRLLTLVSPAWNHGRPFFGGLVALDFNVLSSFGANTKPAWDGHWSNPQVRFSQLVRGIFHGTERAFAFGLDENDTNQLYEITLEDSDDFNGKIPGRLVNRSFDFSGNQASDPFSEKELYMGDIWLSEVKDINFTMDVSYRPDNYPHWVAWDTIGPIQPIGQFGIVDPDTGVPTIEPGFVPRQTLEKPPDDTDPTTKRRLRRGYEFQTALDWTGHVKIDRFRVHATTKPEKSRAR